MTEHGQNPNNLRFPNALATVQGLPAEAIDALWLSEATTSSGTSPWAPPSDHVVTQLIGIGGPKLVELAASVRDPDRLDEVLVAAGNSEEVVTAAVGNPSLRPSTSDVLATKKRSVNLVSHRRAARQALADAAIAGLSGSDLDAVASGLIAAREAVLIVELLTATASAVHVELADVIADALVTETVWGSAGADYRVTRDRVLTLLRPTHPTLAADLADRIAREPGAPLTAESLDTVVAAAKVGVLTPEDVTATADAEAVAYAELLGGLAVDIVTRPAPAPKPTAVKPKSGKTLEVYDSAEDEAMLLDMMGMADVAAHSVLSSNDPVSHERLHDALAAASVETVVDWAEGRLAQRPEPGAVVRELLSMDLPRLQAIAGEVGLRPDPLDGCADLVLVTPSATEADVSPRAARCAAAFLQERFGTDQAAWDIFVQLLADGRDETLVELAAATVGVAVGNLA